MGCIKVTSIELKALARDYKESFSVLSKLVSLAFSFFRRLVTSVILSWELRTVNRKIQYN